MNFKRNIRFFWQRLNRGWDDSETWCLDHTIAKYILPRLKRFREIASGTPSFFIEKSDSQLRKLTDVQREMYYHKMEKKWHKILDKMILAFELTVNDDLKVTPEERELQGKQIEEGLKLFAKYFHHLWW